MISIPTQNYRQKAGNRVKGVTTILGNILNKPALMWWAFEQGFENYTKITERIAKMCGGDFKGVDAQDLAKQVLAMLMEFQPGKLYDKRDKAATAGTLGHLFVENHIKKLPEPDMQVFWSENSATPKEDRKSIESKAQGCYLSFLEWEKAHKFKLIHSELALVSELHPFGGCIDIGATLGERRIIDIKTSKGIYYSMLFQIAAYGHLYNEHFPETPIQGYDIVRLGEDGEFEHKYYPELEDEWTIFLHCLGIQQILDSKGKKL